MKTLLTDSPLDAAALLRAGAVVAFPTETVYGLGADAGDEAAVRKIFAAKGRPPDNPLIVHLGTLAQLDAVAGTRSLAAEALIRGFFPGPLTLILPRQPAIPDVVTGGLDTVGVRMPRHPVAQAFLAACGRPVAAPSANRSGRPSPTTWQAVQADLDGRIAGILRGDRSPAGLESTVVDCTSEPPVLLRAGVVTVEQLRTVVPGLRMAGSSPEAVRSPGTRYRHYTPHATVVLVAHSTEARPEPRSAYIGLTPPPRPAAFGLCLTCSNVAHYAHEVFDFFRRCEAAGIQTIYCQRVPDAGLGRALMDRLHRAAAS